MNHKTLTLAELAALTKSDLIGNPNHRICNVADLESANLDDASFLANPQYEKAMLNSKAGVVFITAQMAEAHAAVCKERNFLINENPSRAFQTTIDFFLGDHLNQLSGFSGVHPTAVIHKTATIGDHVIIGPHTVIDQDAIIGDHTTISAGCYIGLAACIGTHSLIHPNVVIRERCQIGNRVIIQPGAVIGSCGFGYIPDAKGRHIKLNQVGIVIIEDDVEIGANTTIDRSRFKETRVKRGTKIDNLIQIAHGVEIGEDNVIAAQTGFAGSSSTGNHVVIGGQVAVAGHISISDKAMIAGRTGISKSLKEPGKYGGIPAVPLHEYQRNSVFLRNIETYVKQIQALQHQMTELQEKISHLFTKEP